jgi:hypothetical protein
VSFEYASGSPTASDETDAFQIIRSDLICFLAEPVAWIVSPSDLPRKYAHETTIENSTIAADTANAGRAFSFILA